MKKVILGVTAGASIYKSCEVLRKLLHQNCEVHVVPTPDSLKLICEALWRGLSGNNVVTSVFESEESPWPHVSLAKNADAFVVCPATANTIAKLANGFGDNALTATALAVTCPKIICPAMNVHMFENPAVQENIKKLQDQGWILVAPKDGSMACGGSGKGALANPEDIVKAVLEAVK